MLRAACTGAGCTPEAAIRHPKAVGPVVVQHEGQQLGLRTGLQRRLDDDTVGLQFIGSSWYEYAGTLGRQPAARNQEKVQTIWKEQPEHHPAPPASRSER